MIKVIWKMINSFRPFLQTVKKPQIERCDIIQPPSSDKYCNKPSNIKSGHLKCDAIVKLHENDDDAA